MSTAQIILHPKAASVPVVNPAKWNKRTANVVSIRLAVTRRARATAPTPQQENQWRDERSQSERARCIAARRLAISMFDALPGHEVAAKIVRRHLEEDLYEQAAYFSRIRVGAAQSAQSKAETLGAIQ